MAFNSERQHILDPQSVFVMRLVLLFPPPANMGRAPYGGASLVSSYPHVNASLTPNTSIRSLSILHRQKKLYDWQSFVDVDLALQWKFKK